METNVVLDKSFYKAKKRLKFNKDRDLPIYILLLPGMLFLILFKYLPIYGIVVGFQDYIPFKGVLGSKWVGLKHFIFFAKDHNFWRVMFNTLIINIYKIIFGMPVPVIFALLLNEVTNRKIKKTIQTISYLPHFISWVVAAGIISAMLNPESGLVNIILNKVFGVEPIYFLANPRYFRGIIVISATWKEFGLSAVYYIAAITSIDPELYEACIIDGGNRFQQILYITIPGIRNMFIILLVISIGNIVSIGFEQIFLLYNPLVYDVGDVISTYTYRMGIERTQYSLTTAIGFTQSIINFVMVFSANRLSKKISGWALW